MMDEYLKERDDDAERFMDHDESLCQLCHAKGFDKRSLFISCFYYLKEIDKEFINLSHVIDMKNRGYYLRICKNCRGELLARIREWCEAMRDRRDIPKDHDGHDEYCEANIPVREFGRTVMKTENEWRRDNK